MRVAICDDDMHDLEEMESLVSSYGLGTMETSCFRTAQEMYDSNASNPFDLVLLDIEMPEPNGYAIAKKLREDGGTPLVIFVTNSPDYTILGYGVAFRYLRKPVSQESLFPLLDAAVCEIRSNRLLFTDGHCSHAVKFCDIYYIECFRHSITLHTADSEFEFRSTLSDIEAQLPAGHFAKANQGCLVGLRHVSSLGPESVSLENGVRISFSRRRQKDFVACFHQFMRR